MGTTVGNKDIATTGSGHQTVTPPATSLNPPTPPAGPVPVPYPYQARSATASKTKSALKAGGDPVLVKGSEMNCDPPCNQPSQPTGGDVVSHAVKAKAVTTQGSSSTKAGGDPVCATGDMTKCNVMANPQTAQASMPLLKAGGADMAGGTSGEGADKDKKGKRALNAQGAKKCTKTGHPVAVASGHVVDDNVDIELPGAIPLTLERFYSSGRNREQGLLGRGGWVLSVEQWITPDDDTLALRIDDGRTFYFGPIGHGESWFHRGQQLDLHAQQGRLGMEYRLWDLKSRTWRHFAPQIRNGKARLTAIVDAFGNGISLTYEDDRLIDIVDTARRELRFVYSGPSTPDNHLERIEVWARDPKPPGTVATPDPADSAPTLWLWVDYGYDEVGRLVSAQDALGHSERYHYDAHHRMTQVTLKNGVSFHYSYDPDTGRCVKTWGDGGLLTAELNNLPNHEVHVHGTHEPRRYTFTDDGYALSSETMDGRQRRETTYDRDRYPLTTTNGAGEVFTFVYDDRGHRVSMVDPAGNEERYDFEHDLPVRRRDAAGRITRYRHDDRGATTDIEAPNGERFSVSYDANGRISTIHDTSSLRVSFSYDDHHNQVARRDANGAVTRSTYDALGRVCARTDASGRVTQIVRDRLGRPIQVNRPDNTVVRAEYGPLGNVTRHVDATGITTEMTYGGTGVVTSIREGTGQLWTLRYDSDERLIEVENPRAERYTYDYDDVGRVVSVCPFDGRHSHYAYNNAGRVRRIERSDESFLEFDYDLLGNLVAERSTDGSITYQRNPYGWLLEAVVEDLDGQTIVTQWERDANGRITAEVQDGARIVYERDGRGRILSRSLPALAEEQVTDYTFDALGHCQRIEHKTRHGTERVDFARDDGGHVTERRIIAPHAQLTVVRERDTMSRLARQTVCNNTTERELSDRSWNYDSEGRPTQIGDDRWGATRYRYDPIGQLLEAQRDHELESFEYGPARALQQWRQQPGQDSRSQVLTGNVLVEHRGVRYENDACGRRTKKVVPCEDGTSAVTAYYWDVRDRLREVHLPDGRRATYHYDAIGRRVRKEIRAPVSSKDLSAILTAEADRMPTVETTRFLYDGKVLCAELRPEHLGGVRVHVHGPGTFIPLLQVEQKEIFAVITDHVGMPKELIDGRGRVAWAGAHRAWGDLVDTQRDPGTAAVASPFRLLGQYADEESGLCYVRYRYFDPAVARWCSPDPLGLMGGPNPFAFDGSPTMAVDPFGLGCQVDDLIERGVLREDNPIVELLRIIEDSYEERQPKNTDEAIDLMEDAVVEFNPQFEFIQSMGDNVDHGMGEIVVHSRTHTTTITEQGGITLQHEHKGVLLDLHSDNSDDY